jgi:hypothetical protein
MTGRVVGFAAITVAAMSAVGLGGYLAGRTSTPVATQVERTAVAAAAPEAPAPAVAETEAVVPDPTPAPVERALEAAPAAPVKSPKPAAPVASVKPSSRPVPVRGEPAPARPAPVVTEPRSSSEPAPPLVARGETPRTLPGEPVERPNPPSDPMIEARSSDERALVIPPVPPAPRTEEFVVPADSVIGLRLDDTISTETARVEQRVEAHVSRDVRVNGTIVIPANARAQGQVTLVEPGGKFRERARLGVRFHTLVLADGTSVPIQTDVIYRDGQAVSGRSAARIGGSAVGGAIIGAIFGGGKGAAIGAAAGAGAGTAATMATDKSRATLHAGSTVTVRLTNPTTITVEREED